jgi:hypothetical protein
MENVSPPSPAPPPPPSPPPPPLPPPMPLSLLPCPSPAPASPSLVPVRAVSYRWSPGLLPLKPGRFTQCLGRVYASIGRMHRRLGFAPGPYPVRSHRRETSEHATQLEVWGWSTIAKQMISIVQMLGEGGSLVFDHETEDFWHERREVGSQSQ